MRRCGIAERRARPSRFEVVEITGLLFALAAAMLLAYVVPLRARRRYAVAASRDADRFSESLTVLSLRETVPDSHGPSGGNLLVGVSVPVVVEGTGMSEETSPRPVKKRGSGDHAAAREYAALRAKRAARLAGEKYAAQRRLVTVAVTAGITLLFVVLAAFGLIGWLWLALPVSALVAGLVVSAVAGQRNKAVLEEQDARLAQLRQSLRGKDQLQVEPEALADQDLPQVDPANRVVAPGAKLKRALEDHQGKPGDGVQSHTDEAEDLVAQAHKPDEAQAADFQAIEVEASEEGSAQAPQTRVEVEAKSSAGQSESGWTYVPLPEPTYAKKAKIVRRQVHADTDIVSVQPLDGAVVTGRPVRVSTARVTVDIDTASNPTFKFDLDAVLEQRRAQ